MKRAATLVVASASMWAGPGLAQEALAEERREASPPQTIDLLAPENRGGYDPLAQEQCEEERDAARITGEIIVCRNLKRETTDGSWHRQDWQERYARNTAYVNDPQAPDVDRTGLPNGMAPLITIRGCFIGPCPPPLAVIIDVEALPPAPDGSDADRVARGLAPRDNDDQLSNEARSRLEAELGLPPRPGD